MRAHSCALEIHLTAGTFAGTRPPTLRVDSIIQGFLSDFDSAPGTIYRSLSLKSSRARQLISSRIFAKVSLQFFTSVPRSADKE